MITIEQVATASDAELQEVVGSGAQPESALRFAVNLEIERRRVKRESIDQMRWTRIAVCVAAIGSLLSAIATAWPYLVWWMTNAFRFSN